MKKFLCLLIAVVMLVSLISCAPSVETIGSETVVTGNTDAGDTKPEDLPTGAWPTEKIASMASTVNATIPVFDGKGVLNPEMADSNWLLVNFMGADKAEIKAWLNKLYDQGFIQTTLGNMMKVVGNKEMSVGYAMSDGEGYISFITKTIKDTDWPYFTLVYEFGENLGAYIFEPSVFSGDYVFSYDSKTKTVTCNNADEELENAVRDKASYTFSYYDDVAYREHNFYKAVDESKVEGKLMSCYVNRDGSKLTVRFEVTDYVAE